MFEFLLFSWFLTVGIVPEQYDQVAKNRVSITSEQVATVAELGLSATAWDRLTVSTTIENYQYKGDGLYFNP
jgi:hypothetical protein